MTGSEATGKANGHHGQPWFWFCRGGLTNETNVLY